MNSRASYLSSLRARRDKRDEEEIGLVTAGKGMLMLHYSMYEIENRSGLEADSVLGMRHLFVIL